MQIRSGGGQQSPYYTELETAQSNAESSGTGLWSKVQCVTACQLSLAVSAISTCMVHDCNRRPFGHDAGRERYQGLCQDCAYSI